MTDPTRTIADTVRMGMVLLARLLNKVTKGRLKPAHVTILSFLGHIPAAWALATCRPLLAAALITIFGLMDALDGALAREQNTASRLGMFFDAVTDRLKEVIIYAALALYAAKHMPEIQPWVIVAVAGSSLLVSYVKAKGEMALSGLSDDVQALNKTFDDGIARYETRMAFVVVGLITGFLAPLLNFIIALNLITAALRFLTVSQAITTLEHTKQAANNTRTKKQKANNHD